MLNLNEPAWQLCNVIEEDAERLDIAVHKLASGTRLIDCGVKTAGSIEAGQRLAEICMAGLGAVKIIPADPNLWRGQAVQVSTDDPVAACMAAQYAGWEIKGDGFFAMGSG